MTIDTADQTDGNDVTDPAAAPAPDDNETETAPIDINDLSVFAEEIRALIERKLAEIPVPQVEFNTKLDAVQSKVDTLLTILTKADAILAAIGKLTDATNKQTEAMTATKTIITDSSGKPVGIKVA
jgi:hypothetical protein